MSESIYVPCKIEINFEDFIKEPESNIKTYKAGDWRIDIAETTDNYEAWIYQNQTGIKEFMFGMPKKQQSYEKFLEITFYNIPNHAKIYEENRDEEEERFWEEIERNHDCKMCKHEHNDEIIES